MKTCLYVENATKSFDEDFLFRKITFSIDEGSKVALIAKNGTGKTSLLNILAGRDTFDSGSFTIPAGIKVSYLEQDPKFEKGNTVFQTVYGAKGEMMATVREYELALHSRDEKKLEETTAQMDFHQAWDLDAKIRQMLGILKLNNEEQLVNTLSGGQVKRLALAIALINEPDFLILDEPTNHLDLDMIEWLEDYLTKSSLTLLMVTHDRYFLDRICSDILELDEKDIYSYRGNYSQFLQKREERILQKALAAEKAQNLLRTELEWMRRMPKARTTKAKYRIDAFYDLKERSEYSRNDRNIKINLPSARLGKKILTMHDVSKRYDEQVILDHFSYTFSRGEKIGIIGSNGVGKTTFLNIITNRQLPDSGNLEHGDTVVYGYYQQQGLEFEPGRRVIDILQDIAEVVTLGDGKQLSLVQFMNHFLFTPDIQHLQVEKLSGGEKRRLYLMTVLMMNPNFLILDEPTNDFDILTLNVLEDFLLRFGGCVILVSHDRFFMDKLVDHMFIFEGNGVVYDFPGNYSDYRASQKQAITESRRQTKDTPEKFTQTAAGSKRKEGKKRSYREQREAEQLFSEIEVLESEKIMLESLLITGKMNATELIEKSGRLGEVIELIDLKTNRWLELSD